MPMNHDTTLSSVRRILVPKRLIKQPDLLAQMWKRLLYSIPPLKVKGVHNEFCCLHRHASPECHLTSKLCVLIKCPDPITSLYCILQQWNDVTRSPVSAPKRNIQVTYHPPLPLDTPAPPPSEEVCVMCLAAPTHTYTATKDWTNQFSKRLENFFSFFFFNCFRQLRMRKPGM